jgi:predicted DNA-binding ribbon-helix-helix protein
VTTRARKEAGGEVARRSIERVQTGVRIEKRLLQVLKALAESHDLSLGDLLEGIVLHAFEGAAPFGAESLARIAALKSVYGLDLDAADSHLLVERGRRKASTAKGPRS